MVYEIGRNDLNGEQLPKWDTKTYADIYMWMFLSRLKIGLILYFYNLILLSIYYKS